MFETRTNYIKEDLYIRRMDQSNFSYLYYCINYLWILIFKFIYIIYLKFFYIFIDK